MGRLVRRADPHPRGDGTTVIHGPVVDQAALHGLLQKVRDLGLPLVSVRQLDSGRANRPPASANPPSTKEPT